MSNLAEQSSTCNIDRQKPTRAKASLCRSVMMILIVGAATLWSSVACASCGDYLFRHGKRINNSSVSTHHQNSNQVFETYPVELPAPPCHGPNCSGSPVPLMPVPVAPTDLVRGFDQAAILETLGNTSTRRCAIEVPTSERGACFVPLSIFRPPKI